MSHLSQALCTGLCPTALSPPSLTPQNLLLHETLCLASDFSPTVSFPAIFLGAPTICPPFSVGQGLDLVSQGYTSVHHTMYSGSLWGLHSVLMKCINKCKTKHSQQPGEARMGLLDHAIIDWLAPLPSIKQATASHPQFRKTHTH